jgi:hypothetical protein
VQAGTKVSWDADRDAAIDAAHRLWANEQLPGQLAQTLPRPRDFAEASTLVTRDTVADAVACGPDTDQQAAQVQAYLMSHQYESLLKKANFKGSGFPVR